jgi:nucleoside-diphosphate-sugar epimerase
MKALVFGCGYLGSRVAERWLAEGHSVCAVTRSEPNAKTLGEMGISPLLADVTVASSLASLPSADVVLYAVGYDRTSGERRSVVVDGLRNALESLRGKAERLVFISTTSVYGHSHGEWVDEHSPTVPDANAGRTALEAEELIRAAVGIDSVILRLTGLYGPGRLLRRIEQLRAAEPIAGDGDAWLNLIHVEDAAMAVVAAGERLMRSELRSKLYLVTDDRPVQRREYYEHLARVTASTPPSFDAGANSRVVGSGKRCRNDLAKSELGVTLAFPTYIEGLEDAWRRSPQRD